MIIKVVDDHQYASESTSSHSEFDSDYVSERSDTDVDNMSDFEDFESISVPVIDFSKYSSTKPDEVKKLQKELLGDYKLGSIPGTTSSVRELTPQELLSLQHYSAWHKSRGSVLAYKLHAELLTMSTQIPILSLKQVRSLAQELTELYPVHIDMCPKSCIAYTGDYKNLLSCPHVHNKKMCNLPRYKITLSGQKKACAQYTVLPVVASIKALFSNVETSRLLRERDHILQQTLLLFSEAKEKIQYSEYANSITHIIQHRDMNLFQSPRDIAFSVSTDGAQLTMKKKSNTWIMIMIIMNLPSELRYKSNNIIVNFIIPGPNSPADVESFMYPLQQEMARIGEGIWIWDALDSAWFVIRAWIVMILGDMLGSAKLSGLAGHSAVYGDRFSMVQGARASLEKGAKYQYYPFFPPESNKYNPSRPVYSLDNLPIRTLDQYWKYCKALVSETVTTKKNAITRDTGISWIPLCAASNAFLHPTYFPLDPFHLIFENCIPFFWDIWVTISVSSEPVHIPGEIAAKIGDLITLAMRTLPSAFSGPIRNVYTKRQSQFKAFEWMGIAYWYIVPMFLELGVNLELTENYAKFLWIIEYALAIQGRSESDLKILENTLIDFLQEYEKLYIGADPKKVSRARLCIFQLIHIPTHIKWNGSLRTSSQATVERMIGELGSQIRSKKSPFANLENLVLEREKMKLLHLYYPDIKVTSKKIAEQQNIKLLQIHKISQQSILPGHNTSLELKAIFTFIGSKIPIDQITRWGKARIKNQFTIKSILGEKSDNETSRLSRWFEAYINGQVIYGEATAFYMVCTGINTMHLATFHLLEQVEVVLKVATRGKWAKIISVLDMGQITALAGTWSFDGSLIYILKKHAGLSLLPASEDNSESETILEQ